MDVTRVKLLARMLLADVLSVGSAVTAGPVVTPQREAVILDAIEARLQELLKHHEQESDAEVARRFRQDHPQLFSGTIEDRHRAAKDSRK